MKQLQEAVKNRGQNLGNGILKVDNFINHQIDCRLMERAGQEFADRFYPIRDIVDVILTSETSGLIPALMTGVAINRPVIFARKKKSVTMGETYDADAPSHTKGGVVTLSVSKDYLREKMGVLIIDDFLASGNTILAMNRIIDEAGARLVGIGTLIEKSFEGARKKLSHLEVPIVSLVTISSMDDGKILFSQT